LTAKFASDISKVGPAVVVEKKGEREEARLVPYFYATGFFLF
jgi:hypothetical protein